MQSPAQSALQSKAKDATSPLQAEALAIQLATQVMTTLRQQRCKIFS